MKHTTFVYGLETFLFAKVLQNTNQLQNKSTTKQLTTESNGEDNKQLRLKTEGKRAQQLVFTGLKFSQISFTCRCFD